MQAEVAPEALWLRVSELVAQNIGLHFPAERHADLQRGLAAAAAEFGFTDGAACADWLLSTPLTRAQLHTLASHLTIGETYFFRERKTFDALAQRILPELIRSRRGRDQRLRLWSAACSTGEEPYSLAILVQQLLPDWRDWDVTILATDINQRFLQKAAAGVYGEWSFRESPPEFKEAYFRPAPDGRFAIAPEIRNCVHFMHMNLAQEGFPSSMPGIMDVVFCRNVLIYFTASHARKLVANLRHTLADDGWLAVSPSECSQYLFSQFTAVNFPGSILYRKSSAEERTALPWVPLSSDTPPFDAPLLSMPAIGSAFAPEKFPAISAQAPSIAPEPPAPAAADELPGAEAPQEFSRATRMLADQGRLADALACSEQWIAADKVDPGARYVHATILQEMGDREGARSSLRRAVYLQPDFALAHFMLGNLARADARAAEANKHYANALHLLRACAAETLVSESDGITAGRLVEIISTLLAQPDRTRTREAPG